MSNDYLHKGLVPVIPLGLAFAIISLPLSAAIDREKSQTFYEEGLESFKLGSLSATVIHLRNSLQQNPENLPARVLLGEALLKDDQPQAAIKELETGLSMGGDENLILVPLARAYLKVLQPEKVITGIPIGGHEPEVDGQLHLIQGDAYTILGNAKLADEAYLSASALIPTDVRPLLARARLAIKKKKRNLADKLLEQAIALDPNSFELWMFQGLLYRDTGNYSRAKDAFDKAVELRPTSGRALTARAAMWLDVGNTEQAKEDLAKARSLTTDTLESIYLQTLIFYREGRVDEARELLAASAEKLTVVDDDFKQILPNTRLMLGIIAFFRENHEEAVAHFEGFLKVQPNHLGAKRYLASAYANLGDWDSVIKVFRPSTLSEIPMEPMSLSLLAEAYRNKNQHAQAERYYKSALDLAPNAAMLGLRLAMNRVEAGKPEEALSELEWFAEKFPDHVETKMELARVYLKVSKPDEALVIAKDLTASHADDPRALNVAATVLMATGDLFGASQFLRLAAALDNDYVLPKLNLARLEKLQNNLGSAETSYRIILEQRPNNIAAGIELSKLLIEQGMSEEAKARVDHVLSIAPKNYDAQILLIKILQAQRAPVEDIESAAYELQKQYPDDPRPDLLVGRFNAAQGRVADARADFRRAVEKAEFDSPTLTLIAEQQMLVRDMSGALWTLTKALQGNPNNVNAGALQVSVLTGLGELTKAEESLAKHLENHGENAALLLARADLRVALKEYYGALEDYKLAYELEPTSHTATTYFKALVANRETENAIQFMRRWMVANPKDISARMLLGEVLMGTQRYTDAKKVYESLYENGLQEDIVILNNLATAYHLLGDSRALKMAERAYEKGPEIANVLDTYGWIMVDTTDAKKGLAILREAYTRSSNQPGIRYHIGLALMKLGKKQQALEEFEAALAEGAAFVGRNEAENLVSELKQSALVN